jgi:hypothetical protein
MWNLMRYAALDAERPVGAKEAVDAALKLWASDSPQSMLAATGEVLAALWTMPDSLKMLQSIIGAALSTDPRANLRALLVNKVPPTGTKAFDDWQSLLYAACLQGAVLPPWPAASGVTYPLPAASAVITCTPPVATYVPPAVETWVAKGGTIFTYANGKLTGLTTRKALAGAPATCSVSKAVSTTKIFCQLIGGPTNEVAEVAKQ